MYHEVTPGLLALSTAHSVLIQGGFSTEKPRVHSKTVLKLVVELLTYRLVVEINPANLATLLYVLIRRLFCRLSTRLLFRRLPFSFWVTV